MRQKLKLTNFAIALVGAALIPWSRTAAQIPVPASLEEQLQAQYQLTQMGLDGSGPNIKEPGAVLTIQKGGILGVAPTYLGLCPAKYQDGTLHAPTAMCVSMAKLSRSFQTGEKVYFTKIEVKPKNDKVSLKIVACDTCNGTNPPTYYKSQVDFQFAKGYLAMSDAAKIEETIGEVFTVDAATTEPPQAAPPAPAAPAPSPVPAAPVSIKLGQTPDQVVAALGQPEKKVDLGAKQIYVYKDLKVTFVNGKVSDVQ